MAKHTVEASLLYNIPNWNAFADVASWLTNMAISKEEKERKMSVTLIINVIYNALLVCYNRWFSLTDQE